MSNQHYCLVTSMAEKSCARKIHVSPIYPAPSRCFFASGRHRVWQEGIRDDTDLLQAQPTQPLCPGEGSNPGIRAAPSLTSGHGEAMSAIRSPTQRSWCGGAVSHPERLQPGLDQLYNSA